LAKNKRHKSRPDKTEPAPDPEAGFYFKKNSLHLYATKRIFIFRQGEIVIGQAETGGNNRPKNEPPAGVFLAYAPIAVDVRNARPVLVRKRRRVL